MTKAQSRIKFRIGNNNNKKRRKQHEKWCFQFRIYRWKEWNKQKRKQQQQQQQKNAHTVRHTKREKEKEKNEKEYDFRLQCVTHYIVKVWFNVNIIFSPPSVLDRSFHWLGVCRCVCVFLFMCRFFSPLFSFIIIIFFLFFFFVCVCTVYSFSSRCFHRQLSFCTMGAISSQFNRECATGICAMNVHGRARSHTKRVCMIWYVPAKRRNKKLNNNNKQQQPMLWKAFDAALFSHSTYTLQNTSIQKHTHTHF